MKKLDKKKEIQDLLELYRNYLFSLQEREEHGDKYGDTEELIKMYEKKLGGINDNKGSSRRI